MDNNLLKDLNDRNTIFQVTDYKSLNSLLNEGKITLYCGFDPTADSLHIGHLLPMITLKRFQNYGHNLIILVGGATGMIGDPSFKDTERTLNSSDLVQKWSDKIYNQLKQFLNFDDDKAKIVNNLDWFKNMDSISFLRDLGKYFSINSMIQKEAIKQRLERQDVGISFTEFSYNLLQSYDFVKLNLLFNCVLQIGGSDQWGNITSGIDLTRRLNKNIVYGLTLPLVTKSDGTKFGKTESGTVWLDSKKTSPYRFYQFWLNVADNDVYKYLLYFTFLSVDEIKQIELEDKNSVVKPKAQKILAQEMTKLVHGIENLESSQRISNNLFNENYLQLKEVDFEQLSLDGLPTFKVSGERNIIYLLKFSNLAKSNNEARGFISQGAVLANGIKITSIDAILDSSYRYFNKYTILRRGKKNYSLIVWE